MPLLDFETDAVQPAEAKTLGHRTASLALSAIHGLRRPLAILGPDYSVLFSNAAFAEHFGEPDAAQALRLCLEQPAAASGLRQIAAGGDRVFALETAQLPEGLLVIADEVLRSAAASGPASVDAITQLGNRMMFRERLSAMLAPDGGIIEPAAVLFMTLDRFKAVDDSLGHAMGDKLLRVAADRIRSVIGPEGFAARFRGDEFAVILPGVTSHGAAMLAERLIELLGRSYIIDGQLLTIGATLGIAMVPADGATADQIKKNANLALRNARQAGPATYRFFAGALAEEMQARRALEVDLRRALALRELKLVYQPQYNLATRSITGFETLLRWHHPVRGLVSPAQFIPLAEEIGLIVPIGDWVIRTACRDAARWSKPLKLAVNVSATQFRSPELARVIQESLSDSGLAPERLELEITESTLLSDRDAALEVLHKVRAMGVQIAMDDFGTGYSSLSYLRSFPFDKIKIDQSFVRGDPDDPSTDPIVRAIATLGESLGMTTIAEGVETEEQLARITADGCTDVQGYLISRPIEADQVEAFIRKSLPSAPNAAPV